MQKEVSQNATHQTKWKLEKFWAKDSKEIEEKGITPYEVSDIEGNALVNAGINQFWTLGCAGGGVNWGLGAYLGVGDSSAAEAPAQTDLQAATNKLRVAMNGGYPTYGTLQKATWQSDFTSTQANYAWQEFGVFSGASGGTMLNRKISSQGTKTAGQTWRLSLEITLT